MPKIKKKTLSWRIFLRLLSHALWRSLIYVPSFAPNERPQSYINQISLLKTAVLVLILETFKSKRTNFDPPFTLKIAEIEKKMH